MPSYTQVSWERMSNAVEKVRQRLLRAARALEEAQVPYAVSGGNAVAAWVSRVDEAAVRNTRDVDAGDCRNCWTIPKADRSDIRIGETEN